MDWKRERDALIAQTYTLVQSVYGKKADIATMETRLPPVTPTQTPRRPSPELAPAQAEATPVVPAKPAMSAVRGPRSGLPQRSPLPMTVQNEVRIEIQTRIASFRAHQDRFNRERADFFNATLARLRATLK